MSPKNILMTTPNGFRIAYAINAHMRNADGTLRVVDQGRAREQWRRLFDLYKTLGFRVSVLEDRPEFPDMVFCANQTFPFIDREGQPAVVLGRMNSSFRAGEVPFFRAWAEREGLKIYELDETCFKGSFEGSGDAIWNFETGDVFGGHGFRTDVRAYDELERITGCAIQRLALVDERFYHLDTCLVVLNKTSAAYVEEAFSPDARALLQSKFSNLIRIDVREAVDAFAGNAFCPDGENVILQKGAKRFVENLHRHGFKTHEVETDEFVKSGGSVFCLKQQYWSAT